MYQYNFINRSGMNPMRFNSISTTQIMAPNAIFKGGNNDSKHRIIKTKNFTNAQTIDNGKAFPLKNIYPPQKDKKVYIEDNDTEIFIRNLCDGKPLGNPYISNDFSADYVSNNGKNALIPNK